MSALPPKADISQTSWDVRFVPQADSCTAAILSLFDRPVDAARHRKRYGIKLVHGTTSVPLGIQCFPMALQRTRL
jgi:hypothetical protein